MRFAWPGRLAGALLLISAGAMARAEAPGMPPMATYVLGIYSRGPAWTAEKSARLDSLQAGHLANMGRMAEAGPLVGAGPFQRAGDLRGLLIFRADSVAAVRALAARDPMLAAGHLKLDLIPWYAPAGIGEAYRRLAARPGHRDSMVRLQVVFLRRGPRWTAAPSPALDSLQAAHVAHILGRLGDGSMACGGPLEDDERLGVCVFRGDSLAARRLAESDPAVRAGRLAVEQHTWWCAWGVMPGDTLR